MSSGGSAEDGAGPPGRRGEPPRRPRRPVISSVTGKPIADWEPTRDAWRDRPVFEETTRDERPDAGDESNTRRLLEERPPHWEPTDRDGG